MQPIYWLHAFSASFIIKDILSLSNIWYNLRNASLEFR